MNVLIKDDKGVETSGADTGPRVLMFLTVRFQYLPRALRLLFRLNSALHITRYEVIVARHITTTVEYRG
jgi:hypothetical protein